MIKIGDKTLETEGTCKYLGLALNGIGRKLLTSKTLLFLSFTIEIIMDLFIFSGITPVHKIELKKSLRT